MRIAAIVGLFACAYAGAAEALAQSAGGPSRGVLFRIDSRLGYLVTGTEGFADRPLFGVDGGIQLGQARPGGPPALGFTFGASIESGHIFAREATISTRVLVGIETPWAVSGSAGPRGTLEFVPSAQIGYQHAFEDDERHGLTLRVAPGLRVLPRGSSMFLTLEPLALVLLSRPPVGPGQGSSRVAVELGVLKWGWRL